MESAFWCIYQIGLVVVVVLELFGLIIQEQNSVKRAACLVVRLEESIKEVTGSRFLCFFYNKRFKIYYLKDGYREEEANLYWCIPQIAAAARNWPNLNQKQGRSPWILHMDARGPNTWTIFHCFPRWSTWGTGSKMELVLMWGTRAVMGCQHHSLTHFATSAVLIPTYYGGRTVIFIILAFGWKSTSPREWIFCW